MRFSSNNFLIVLIGAILVCFVAFLNHFPVVYPDTAAYIFSGFNNTVLWDRPVFYGLFIRHMSLATSPWFVIFAQGLLVSYIVYNTFNIFYTGDKRNIIFIFSLILLTIASSISYNTSILLPDIFSALCVLCFINLLLNDRLGKLQRVIFYILFIYSMLVHFSNFFVLFMFSLLFLIYLLVKRLKGLHVSFKRSRIISIFISICSILIIAPSVNYAFSKRFSFSEGSHVFIINHLLEIGVLEEYLNNECAHKNYKICRYKDQLGGDFIWSNDSPFYKMGGVDSTKNEYNKIIWDIMTTPKYFKEVAIQSVEFSLVQFFTFNIPSNGQNDMRILRVDAFQKYNRAYIASLQSNNKLDPHLHILDELQRIFVLLSMGIFMCVLFIPTIFKLLSPQLKWMVVIVITMCYINAAICSNLATIVDRYQDRIIWLIPLTAIIIVEHFISLYLTNLKKADVNNK